MKLAHLLTPKKVVILMILVFAFGFIVWLVRRQRRLMRADLQKRGLVPGKRRRHSNSSRGPEKRNPTLAEVGSGLPAVRHAPPPGPIDGK